LIKLTLEGEPEKAAWEIWDDDNQSFIMMRRFMSERKIAPTREQLQAFARVHEVKLSYAEVAPLMIEFRKKLLDNMVGVVVTCMDEQQHTEKGALRSWKEKNDRLQCEVQAEGRFVFTSVKHVPLTMSEEFADWLAFVD